MVVKSAVPEFIFAILFEEHDEEISAKSLIDDTANNAEARYVTTEVSFEKIRGAKKSRHREARRHASKNRKNPTVHYRHPEYAYNHAFENPRHMRHQKRSIIARGIEDYLDELEVLEMQKRLQDEVDYMKEELEVLYKDKERLTNRLNLINKAISRSVDYLEDLTKKL